MFTSVLGMSSTVKVTFVGATLVNASTGLMRMVKGSLIVRPPVHLTLTVVRTWWNTFTPKDMVTWYVDMKAREVAEAKAKEERASSRTSFLNPVALHATPALFAAPKKHRNNPADKTKQLGTAGLFIEKNEVYMYGGSDSEASASGAAPASIIESEDEEVPPWESLEEEL